MMCSSKASSLWSSTSGWWSMINSMREAGLYVGRQGDDIKRLFPSVAVLASRSLRNREDNPQAKRRRRRQHQKRVRGDGLGEAAGAPLHLPPWTSRPVDRARGRYTWPPAGMLTQPSLCMVVCSVVGFKWTLLVVSD